MHTIHQTLDDMLHTKGPGKRKMDTRKIANNTYLRHIVFADDKEGYALRLHNTDVAVFHPDGTVTLNSGGWLTPTTKDRINTALGWYGRDPILRVWSDRGTWYLNVLRVDGWEQVERFYDGMRLDAQGNIVNDDDTPDFEAVDERNRELKRKIDSYLDGLTCQVYLDTIKSGAGGDCWYCLHVLDDDTVENVDLHLESHLDERYYMLSLFRNALAAKGYPMPDTLLSFAAMGCEKGDQHALRLLKGALGTYFRKRLYQGKAAR